MNGKPKNILIFDQFSFLGGGQVVLLSVVAAALGVADNTVVACPKDGILFRALKEKYGQEISLVPIRHIDLHHGKKTFADYFKLFFYSIYLVVTNFNLLRHADLIYANGPRQFPALFFASWAFRKPCIYHIHIQHSVIEQKLIKLLADFRFTKRVIVNSEFTLRSMESVIPKIKSNPRVTVVENALTSRFDLLKFVDRFTMQDGKLRIGVLGTLRPEKGQDLVISCANKNLDIDFHLVGRTGSGAEKWVEKLMHQAPSNVTFHGERADIVTAIDEIGINVVLVPSRWQEPFGLVAIEGMACSCLTVVFDSGALTDIAAKTGAIVCKQLDGLQDMVNALRIMTLEERLSLAREQYFSTFQHFRSDRYIDAIRNIISSA